MRLLSAAPFASNILRISRLTPVFFPSRISFQAGMMSYQPAYFTGICRPKAHFCTASHPFSLIEGGLVFETTSTTKEYPYSPIDRESDTPRLVRISVYLSWECFSASCVSGIHIVPALIQAKPIFSDKRLISARKPEASSKEAFPAIESCRVFFRLSTFIGVSLSVCLFPKSNANYTPTHNRNLLHYACKVPKVLV